jgi:hypothetical protein
VAEILETWRAVAARLSRRDEFEALRLVECCSAARACCARSCLAAGDFEQLERRPRLGIDWRDVVFWAEYEDHAAENPRRVRSMEEPLG